MFVCLQLGSREHYAVPRALHAMGRLAALITDAWVPPGSPWRLLPGKLGDRWHPALATANVRAFTAGRVRFDARMRLSNRGGWEVILGRNRWFQERALQSMHTAPGLRCSKSACSPIDAIFSYSYTARLAFREARRHGLRCVLGQIDPGPAEERLVTRLAGRHWQLLPGGGPAAPASYWNEWREEVDLADTVIANSEWSARLLLEEGVPGSKIAVVPLAYEPPRTSPPEKRYPRSFASGRPLRVLFLGQIVLRKGIGPLFEAIQALKIEPIHFDFAGPLGILIPPEIRSLPNVAFHGPVDRRQADALYAAADVFILPTHSDGFALTQLEAAAWGLPMIVSKHCGRVVEHGSNGLLLGEVDADSIETALRACLASPEMLRAMSRHRLDWGKYSLGMLGKAIAGRPGEPA